MLGITNHRLAVVTKENYHVQKSVGNFMFGPFGRFCE